MKKIKFDYGRDANRMLMRKLAVSFLSKGRLQTTLAKAKVLRPYLEKMVSKMKIKSEANKNYLLKFLGDQEIINTGFDTIGKALSSVNGGYVRIVKLGMRGTDGAQIAKIEWVYPVKKVKDEKSNSTDKTS